MTEKKVTPKKTAPKKVAPKAENAKEEVKDVVKEVVEVKRKINMDDHIDIMNNTTGRYRYASKTGYTVEMDEYGDTESISFSELRTMSSSQKAHIREAYIIILDEDAVDELGYNKLYENVFDAEGVDNLLNGRDYEKLEKVLPKMPKTMQETVASVAKRRFKTRELSDLNVRDILERTLKIKIEL